MIKIRKGYTYDEISVGDTAKFTKTITESDVHSFCAITGDFNPAHIDDVYMHNSALGKKMNGRIAHGALVAGLISTVMGTYLPGKGCLYLSQTSNFKLPVKFGDTITATAEVVEKLPKNRLKIHTTCTNQNGDIVIDGEALVIAASNIESTE
jgi:3-hydroxybutyryl-CoA dehydratase